MSVVGEGEGGRKAGESSKQRFKKRENVHTHPFLSTLEKKHTAFLQIITLFVFIFFFSQ